MHACVGLPTAATCTGSTPATQRIDQVIPVGEVPKYVAVTPDDKHVLVTNWCSFDLSVVDVATHKEVAQVPIGRYPRGIASRRTAATAYVAVMGASDIARGRPRARGG